MISNITNTKIMNILYIIFYLQNLGWVLSQFGVATFQGLDGQAQLAVSALHRTALAPGRKQPTMHSRSLFFCGVYLLGQGRYRKLQQ